ncbi:DUF4340 domain-containing protein [Spirochaetia bacterium 38H-sp]|uniref:DUF4340 domain-containing protein n=1 Tax=Rarispira pelagica TaxID=3141764 RepID=A0ABU9UBP1_9SPIR
MEKKTRVLFAVNTVLLFLLIIRGAMPFFSNRTGSLIKLKEAAINKIEINSGIILTRQGQSWKIKDGNILYPANTDAVDKFLSMLMLIDNNTPVTEKDSPALMGEKPLKVVLTADYGRSQTLLIGKRSPVPGKRYVKLEGESAIYSADGSAGFYAGQTAAFWKELRPLSGLAPADIMVLQYRSLASNKEYLLAQVEENNKTTWKLRKKNMFADIQPQNAVSFLLPITEAKAKDVLPLPEENLSPISKLSVETIEGIKKFFIFSYGGSICIAEEGKRYYFYDISKLYTELEEADFAR